MDARVARTLATVRQAATELLVQRGPGAVTVDAVVAKSGVAKSTIYRHWESRDELLADVVQCMAPALEEPAPDLPFELALRALMRTVVATFSDPEWSRVVPAVLLLKLTEERIAGVERDMHRRQREIFETIVQRGVEEGALRPGLDVEEVAAQLLGPVLFAQVSDTLVVDEALGDRIVDHFLAAERALVERTTTPG